MTRARAKLNLALTTASAPPAVTTSRTAAQTVDVAGDANVLCAWVSGMKSVRTPLRTYGRRSAASATSRGAAADSPQASTSAQTLDDSPTAGRTSGRSSAFGVRSAERLPFLYTKLIHRMHGRML